MAGSTTGFGIEVGPQVKVGGGTLPPMFSRSWQDRDEVGDVRKFFEEERGSVSITQAVCLTHRIDIADTARKELLNGFVSAVRALAAVAGAGEERRAAEFKRFVGEFGTHYATTSKLGTRLVMERRYTKAERTKVDKVKPTITTTCSVKLRFWFISNCKITERG